MTLAFTSFRPTALISWLTLKRVFQLFRCYPIHHLIVLFLLTDILLDRRFIKSHRTYIVPRSPEVTVAEFILQVTVPVEYHHGAFALQIAHDLRYAILGWDGEQQVDVIRHHMSFSYFYPFPFTQVFYDIPDICSKLVIYDFSSVFGSEYDVVLAQPLSMC